jgi:cell division protein FtsB
MALNQYNPHMRYKERAAQRMVSMLGMLAVILVSMLVGFWFGKQYAAEQVIKQKDQITALTQERDLLQDQVTELSATAQTANKRYEQLQDEVESIIPPGPMQDLVTLVREQLTQGMDPERLSFVIRSARPPTGCVDPDSKRFVIGTPANKGPKSIAAIADGAVEISGTGSSAFNDKNQPEAWYDPAKKVAISFKTEEKVEVKKGILPLRYSVVVKDREYRFTIEQGARSFAKVTYDSCNYP